jgi:hypothetical protein
MMNYFLSTICLFFIFSDTCSQGLDTKLLGKWKLTKDEGFEFFINAPESQNQPADQQEAFFELMERFHNQSFKNFFSLDSMTSTVLDGKNILQEKSIWNVREADSIITWTSQFQPKVLQAKIIKLTENELILTYLLHDQTLGRFKTHYEKVEEENSENEKSPR